MTARPADKRKESDCVSCKVEDWGLGLRAVFQAVRISPALHPLGERFVQTDKFSLTQHGLAERIRNLEGQGQDASVSRAALKEMVGREGMYCDPV